jgi:hypothetical protein
VHPVALLSVTKGVFYFLIDTEAWRAMNGNKILDGKCHSEDLGVDGTITEEKRVYGLTELVESNGNASSLQSESTRF